MSTIAVGPVTRSPFTAIASAPASHSSSTTVRTASPFPLKWAGSPAPPPRRRECRVEWLRQAAAPLPRRLHRPDLRAQVEDPLLERLLLPLQVQRRLDERR